MDVKPSEYSICTKPNLEQVRSLKLVTDKNLGDRPCLIPGAAHSGWKWLLVVMKAEQ